MPEKNRRWCFPALISESSSAPSSQITLCAGGTSAGTACRKSPSTAVFSAKTRFPSSQISAFCALAARSPCICSRLWGALRFAQQPTGLTLPFGSCGAAGETCKETLPRKASESIAHVAGFGFHSEGCGPTNLPEGFFDSLRPPLDRRPFLFQECPSCWASSSAILSRSTSTFSRSASRRASAHFW